jgi:hypothetical protein
MTGIDEQSDAFRKSDLEALLNDLRELVAWKGGSRRPLTMAAPQ